MYHVTLKVNCGRFSTWCTNTPKKDRDSSNTGRVPVSGYSLCRYEGTLSDLMAGKAECLKQLNVEDDVTP